MREIRERLLDILEAIENIEKYVVKGREAFKSDELIQTWFVRQLQIIGEAVRSLPQEMRDTAPEIPWTKIVGMRNILTHSYFEIDTELVWDAVSKDVPELKLIIEQLIKKFE